MMAVSELTAVVTTVAVAIVTNANESEKDKNLAHVNPRLFSLYARRPSCCL
jgi:hypothetical protein